MYHEYLSVSCESIALKALIIEWGRVKGHVEGLVEELKGSHIVADMDHLVDWLSKISFFWNKIAQNISSLTFKNILFFDKNLLKIFVPHRIVLVERQTGEVRCKLIMNLQQNKNRSVPNYKI